MLTLLSPAKKQELNNHETTIRTTKPLFIKEANTLAGILKKYNASQLSKLMGISDKLATLNTARFKTFNAEKNTPQNSHAALLTFKGDVYRSMAPEELDTNQLKFAQQHVLLLSGLYGVLRPLDAMQTHRLEMSTTLKNPNGKDLYAFWGETLTKKINALLSKQTEKTVINLASKEYASAVQFDKIKGDVITIHFKEKRNGALKVIGLLAKRARGAMTRYIINNEIDTPEALKDFRMDSYRFQKSLSTDTDWVFVR